MPLYKNDPKLENKDEPTKTTTKKENEVTQPSVPSLPTSTAPPGSPQAPGPQKVLPFSGSFSLCFLQGVINSNPLPCAYSTLCSKQESYPWGPSILLLPHPQNLPAGPHQPPRVAGGLLRAKLISPLPSQDPHQKPHCPQPLQGGCPWARGWGHWLAGQASRTLENLTRVTSSPF